MTDFRIAAAGRRPKSRRRIDNCEIIPIMGLPNKEHAARYSHSGVET